MQMPSTGEAAAVWLGFSLFSLFAFHAPDGPFSESDLRRDEKVAGTVLLTLAGPIPTGIFLAAGAWWISGAMCTGTLSLVLRVFPGLRKLRRKPSIPMARIITKP